MQVEQLLLIYYFPSPLTTQRLLCNISFFPLGYYQQNVLPVFLFKKQKTLGNHPLIFPIPFQPPSYFYLFTTKCFEWVVYTCTLCLFGLLLHHSSRTSLVKVIWLPLSKSKDQVSVLISYIYFHIISCIIYRWHLPSLDSFS